MHTLLVQATPEERRVAVLEGSVLVEYFAERRYDRGLVGNIYKGRVLRVMQGVDAAFVEIGIGRSAFLQLGDALVPRDAVPDEVPSEDEGDEGTRIALDVTPAAGQRRPEPPAVGQDLLVQVTRDAYGGKGPRLTTQISFPGRNLVYFPATPLLGVSRRIEDDAERSRLKDALRPHLPQGAGVILRTAAVGRPEAELVEDLDFLKALWDRVRDFGEDLQAPALVHADLDLLLRAARDLLTDDCERMIVDTEEDYDRLLQFVDSFMPRLDSRIALHREPEALFDRWGVEPALAGLLDRVVWLKSGGSIVIDATEALTAIDVNTGGASSKGDPEETLFLTNLEAAREIAYQLRLRNIGGIVVIDFIDMRDPSHRAKVQEVLQAELRRDHAHTEVQPMSRLGLVEMTRKRARETAVATMTAKCPCCEGRGWVRSPEHLCAEIVRALRRQLDLPSVRGARVLAHPKVVEMLIETWRTSLGDLETRFQKPVRLVRREDFHVEAFQVRTE